LGRLILRVTHAYNPFGFFAPNAKRLPGKAGIRVAIPFRVANPGALGLLHRNAYGTALTEGKGIVTKECLWNIPGLKLRVGRMFLEFGSWVRIFILGR